MNKKNITTLIITLIIGVVLFISMTAKKLEEDIYTFYQVYLNGEKIGTINSVDKLYALIDNNQSNIKKEYDVNNVYPPTDLQIVATNSYTSLTDDVETIYKRIEEKDDFTIKGYKVTVHGKDDTYTINVLDKDIFYNAAKRFVKAFLDENEYEKYINNNQEEIVETGRIIRNMKFSENISIKEDYISVKEKIYTDELELSKFLLFGDNPETHEYTIKLGDTIASVSSENKLNPEEFLIANPEYKSENSLLRVGDKVNVTLIAPKLTFNYELYEIYDEIDYFTKETKQDASKDIGYSSITTPGQNGLIRYEEIYTVTNGVRPQSAEPKVHAVLRETINQVTTVGTHNPNPYIPVNPVEVTGDWGWPTNRGYIITTYYEWRWGSFHSALDIAIGGGNSPIYAAADGVVTYVYNGCPTVGYGVSDTCGGGLGNRVDIDHGGGYKIRYGHMASGIKVSVGQKVSKGQVLGNMGSSGSSTGYHLHFETSYNGQTFNPLELYR